MDIQLEEGEIDETSEEEDGFNPYTPLERPTLHFEPPKQDVRCEIPAMEEDSPGINQIKPSTLLISDSETDDEEICTKRLKLTLPAKKKYNIWSKDPNADLTDFLNQVGMDEKPPPEISRNVENYPLPFERNERSSTNYRQKKRKLPIRKKFMEEGRPNMKKMVRNLDSLEVNESNTIEEVAEDITKKLKECNQELMLRIVIVLGKIKAIQLYEKTRVIEKLGGMLIVNGSRKRTSGGVFIFLVRNDKELSEDKLTAIFENDVPQQKKIRIPKSKMKKRRKKKSSRKNKTKDNSSELSNPPPSPNLPDVSPKKDMLIELAKLDQQEGMAELHIDDDDDDDDDEEEEEDDFLSYEDMDFPEIV